ncbi:cation:proton antiporter domain-containing protein [Candidatus Nitrospira allomarina]|jgi:K+:H+ antiporter|uniref:Cation:proton antiporter n=1 Tax=Candidatus Nitrospira allomarina TaxID=3020900 RepID=A0AA96GHR7_9BACT|nr:cation:proton antiporter [Candidatus Nitrospira allomarina]WNM59118.1 cation:proton antiporter [Candidatus Nitrospira allomarina]
MSEVHILRDVLIIFSISVLVVFVFQKLRLPAVAGFLVSGTLVGPYGLNLISDLHQVETLAEIGVVLLLFTIGLETSLSRIRASRRLLWVGGPLQILSMLSVVALGGWFLGRSWEESVFWGLLLSLSSTAIVLKILGDRGEMDALHGQATMAILIFQDLAVVAMILLTPVLGTGSQGETGVIVETLVKSVLVVGLIVLAARVLVPHVLHLIVGTRSRELFLLSIIVLGLGTAWLTSLAGLSLALGAFIAGLVISESEYSHQALAEVIPFRDSFNSLFFVSVGMLMNPSVIAEFPILVMGLLVLVVLGKFLTGTGAVFLAGVPVSTALLTGVALAQVGEFAFILARVGQGEGLLNTHAYNIFLAVSVLSMTITPFLIQWAPRLARRTEALDRLKHWFPRRQVNVRQSIKIKVKDHVIIVGYGLNGRNLARVLSDMEIPFVVLDVNPDVVQADQKKGRGTMLYGDGTNPRVLTQAGILLARVLVVATSDPFGARRIVQQARQLNPNLHIVVRTRYLKELQDLQELGANDVVPEEFETSIEIFALVLRTYQTPKNRIQDKVEQIRREGYLLLRRGELPELAHHLRAGTLADVQVDTCRVENDSPALGKPLTQLHIHGRTGASVIAITRDGVTQSNPSHETILEPGDVLVLLGAREQIRKAIALLVDVKM